MHLTHIVVVLATFAFALVLSTRSCPSRARAQAVDLQSELTAEVDGKDESLALLQFVIANRKGRSCGAKRSKLVVSNMNQEGGEVQTTDQRSIPESEVLELARALPPNENVMFLYECEVSGKTFFAKGISISHVVYGDKDGWNANLMRVGNALEEARPSPASLSDAAVAYALTEASRQMNEVLPTVFSGGAQLDTVELAEKTLIYTFTLAADASDLNASRVNRKYREPPPLDHF